MADISSFQDLPNQSQNSGSGDGQSTSGQQSAVGAVEDINRQFQERDVSDKAKQLGLSYIDITSIPINVDLLYLLEYEEAKKALCMPFFRVGKKLRVAVSDPEAPETKTVLEKLRAKGYLLNVTLASDKGILAKIEEMYASKQYKVKQEIVNVVKDEELAAYEKEIENLTQLKDKLADISSEEALNFINVGAIKTGTSDIHFQPEEGKVLVRFRIDGVLQKIFEMTKEVYGNIANQIKYKSKMKLNIDNVPQDGRYSFTINQKKIDVRVSSLPTEFGESIVCRLLDSRRGVVSFEDLGFRRDALELLHMASSLSHGMVLVTGPTGSGKTTTLYSLIHEYNKPENKIITLEDPVEYMISNVSQSQINEKRDYTFASGLRAILRQNPDVVMIGEVRDLETAEACAQAALTGHVLLTTLHTNSAVEAIPRLVNMGLPPFMIAPTLHLVIAQRLVRRVCSKCQDISPMNKAEEEEINEVVSYIRTIKPNLSITIPNQIAHAHPDGCDFCSHTGYRGQSTVVEAFLVDLDVKELILDKASSVKIIEAARQKGMLTMREDGILKVLELTTTLSEVHRVTNVLSNPFRGLSSL